MQTRRDSRTQADRRTRTKKKHTPPHCDPDLKEGEEEEGQAISGSTFELRADERRQKQKTSKDQTTE